MADLTREQEEAAREVAELLGIDLPSAREAVAMAEGLDQGCVVEG